MVSKVVSIASCSFVIAFTVSCSEIKKIDEMKDNTSQMNETTKTLLDKTGEMKDKLGEMSKTTEDLNANVGDLLSVAKEDLVDRLGNVETNMAELFDSMRQGDGSALRRNAFDSLQRARSLQARVAEAGLYMMSFEFQVMGNVGMDALPEQRERLYQQAVLEFFLKLDDIAPTKGKIWPQAKPDVDDLQSDENRASAFNAMAFALHKTNRKQHADPFYGRPMSMYDLIINALTLKPEIDNGRLVLPAGPHYIKEVLARPARVRQLLQTRYNMFAYGLLGLSTNLTESTTLGQAMALIGGLDVNVSQSRLGVAGLTYIKEEILDPAVRTTSDMYQLGLIPERTMLTKFVMSRSKLTPANAQEATTSLERSVIELWHQYCSPDEATLSEKRR